MTHIGYCWKGQEAKRKIIQDKYLRPVKIVYKKKKK